MILKQLRKLLKLTYYY